MPDTCSASDLDELIRSITMKVYSEHHVALTAIGVYSVNTKDEHIKAMRETIRKAVMEEEHVLQMHGFYVNEEKKTIRFDVVIGFDAPDRHAVHKAVIDKVQALFPEYTLQIAMDIDFSDL